MKVLFLHGLESNHKSEKVHYLKSLNIEVLAPEMLYREDPHLFTKILNLVHFEKPDLIIGSSMGGFFGYHIGMHYKTNLLLLNPALARNSLGLTLPDLGEQKSVVWALLGELDELVNPFESEKILNTCNAKITWGAHGHRTPIEPFKNITMSIMTQLTATKNTGIGKNINF